MATTKIKIIYGQWTSEEAKAKSEVPGVIVFNRTNSDNSENEGNEIWANGHLMAANYSGSLADIVERVVTLETMSKKFKEELYKDAVFTVEYTEEGETTVVPVTRSVEDDAVRYYVKDDSGEPTDIVAATEDKTTGQITYSENYSNLARENIFDTIFEAIENRMVWKQYDPDEIEEANI